jgi:hypothetical protein
MKINMTDSKKNIVSSFILFAAAFFIPSIICLIILLISICFLFVSKKMNSGSEKFFLFYGKEYIFLFLILSLISPLSWSIRNEMATGYYTISSIDYVNLKFFRALPVLALKNSTPIEFEEKKLFINIKLLTNGMTRLKVLKKVN